MSAKPVTPIRKSTSLRNGQQQGNGSFTDRPPSASMEVLPPDPSMAGLAQLAADLRDSKRSGVVHSVSSPQGKRPPSSGSSGSLPPSSMGGAGGGASVSHSLDAGAVGSTSGGRRSSQVVQLASTRPAEQAPVPPLPLASVSPIYSVASSTDFTPARGGVAPGDPGPPPASSTPRISTSQPPLASATPRPDPTSAAGVSVSSSQQQPLPLSHAGGDSTPLLASVLASAAGRPGPGAGPLASSVSALNPMNLSSSSLPASTSSPSASSQWPTSSGIPSHQAATPTKQSVAPTAHLRSSTGAPPSPLPSHSPLPGSPSPLPSRSGTAVHASVASQPHSVYASRADSSMLHPDDEEDDAASQGPPDTPQSVASGRAGAFRGTGTFFTGLNRDFGFGGGPEPEDSELGPPAGPGLSSLNASTATLPLAASHSQAAFTDAVSVISRLNPMQSPTSSEAGGDEPEEAVDPETAAYMAAYEDEGRELMSEWSNPMMTPRDSSSPRDGAAGAGEGEGKESLLSVIHGLFVEEEGKKKKKKEAGEGEEGAEGGEQEGEGEGMKEGGKEEEEQEEEEEEEEQEEEEQEQEEDARAASMRELEEQLREQERRRSELGDYITHLQELTDEEGGKLVELPRNYLAMVEGLIRKQRSESTVLKGWLGPRRFEDLPINQLPDSHPDPEVQEGLGRIKELDGRLQEKTLEALMIARETFPEKWAEEEARRLERHSKRVEEALKKQRMRRLRAGRLSRAVGGGDGGSRGASAASSMEGSLGGASLAGSSVQGGTAGQAYSRFFHLRPEEEELVEAILSRGDDAEEEAVNPFDLTAIEEVELEIEDSRMNIGLERMLSRAQSALTGEVSSAAALFPQQGDGSAEQPGVNAGSGTGSEAAAGGEGQGAGLGAEASSRPGSAVGPAPGAANGGLTSAPSSASVPPPPQPRKMSLAAINARLEAYALEHEWNADGGLADFAAVAAGPGAQQHAGAPGSEVSGPVSAAAAGGAAAPGSVGGGRPGSPGGRSQAGRSVGGGSTTVGGRRDYLREAREAKELGDREKDLDARIRAFKVSDPRIHLTPDQLHLLVEECTRLEAMHRARCEELQEQKRQAEKRAERQAEKQAAQQQKQEKEQARKDKGATPRGAAAGSAASTPSGRQRAETRMLPSPSGGAGAAGGTPPLPLPSPSASPSAAAGRGGSGGPPPLAGESSEGAGMRRKSSVPAAAGTRVSPSGPAAAAAAGAAPARVWSAGNAGASSSAAPAGAGGERVAVAGRRAGSASGRAVGAGLGDGVAAVKGLEGKVVVEAWGPETGEAAGAAGGAAPPPPLPSNGIPPVR